MTQDEDIDNGLLLVTGEDRLNSSSNDTEQSIGDPLNNAAEETPSLNRLSIG